VAAAAAVGAVMTPLQEKERYDRSFAAAANVASAPSGMLIPPSNLMIVYSLVSGTSVAALFVAGYLPGIAWALVCMVAVHLYARSRPELRVTERIGLARSLKVLLDAVPALLLIVVAIGGILAGLFTATEASCIAVLYALLLSFVYRAISVRQLPGILIDAAKTTAVVMFLIGVSTVMGFVLSFARVPQTVSEGLFGLTTNPVAILLLIALVLLVVGCFMDATPAVLIFTPIFLPIVESFMIVLGVCIGTITPPVGTILFVGAKVADLAIEPVVRRLVPFFAALVVVFIIVIFTPGLSLWLPGLLGLL
jgi:tripartite ATP-independent transporter DctM subunit